MINTSFVTKESRQQDSLQVTTQPIYQNELMSLSFQVTLQPWFTKFLATLGPVHPSAGTCDTTLDGLSVSSQIRQSVASLNTLNKLGFCGCTTTPPKLPTSGAGMVGEQRALEDVTSNHKPDTSSVNVTTNEGSKNGDLDFPDATKTELKDQEVFDSHPHKEIHVTNPKTGREIKKLVCLVKG